MLEVLRKTSENVFVPLTIGGGIREFTDSCGKHYSALDVAAEYFRSGADKISIGSDAVYAVEEFLQSGKRSGKSAIEQISIVYGAQAVVISVDPRRVYVKARRIPIIPLLKPLPLGRRARNFVGINAPSKVAGRGVILMPSSSPPPARCWGRVRFCSIVSTRTEPTQGLIMS